MCVIAPQELGSTDLTMTINFKLMILILALNLSGQVHTGEIIGGKKVALHGRPYMVLVETHVQTGNQTGKPSYCGGFILNAEFVMTAAHCQPNHFRSHTVWLGFNKYSNRNMSIPVEKSIPRKDFNATDCRNDMMLLKLSSKVNFSQDVRPIALAGEDDDFLPKSCSVSGWGSTNSNGKRMSHVLMEANVTIIASEKCPKENSYCSEGETGPYTGDSGGPLVCEDGKAYGVVSAGKESGQLLRSYTKIPDYRSWIDMIMKNPENALILG
ncbi:granzyme E-like [Labrus mixtus]|uniref:granzyme E-like n=1 Tax=Labrus mixtus TaxID=508554 RepID=UPI0029C0C2B1|nr:granzyme E-like [Labrus mixtus]